MTQVTLFDRIRCVNRAMAYVSASFAAHHWQVAYTAVELARLVGLPPTHICRLATAALLHDLGEMVLPETVENVIYDTDLADRRSPLGADVLRHYTPFWEAEPLVRHLHHFPESTEGLPDWSEMDLTLLHILQISEYVAAQWTDRGDLAFAKLVRQCLEQPELRDVGAQIRAAFRVLGAKEAYWYGMRDGHVLQDGRLEGVEWPVIFASREDNAAFLKVLSVLLYWWSPHSGYHAFGTGAIATALAEAMGLDPVISSDLRSAAWGMDMGHLKVDRGLLLRPGKLKAEELIAMQAHVYYSVQLLQGQVHADCLSLIAYHHEHLNGSGYPYRVSNATLTTTHQILIMANILAAVLEERPYRGPLDPAECEAALSALAGSVVSEDLVEMAVAQFSTLQVRHGTAVQEGRAWYDAFTLKTAWTRN